MTYPSTHIRKEKNKKEKKRIKKRKKRTPLTHNNPLIKLLIINNKHII
jgi:hypothetical protein